MENIYTFNRQGTIEDILLDNYLAELRKVIGDSVVRFDGVIEEVIEALDFLGWLATLGTNVAITVEIQIRITNELKAMADRILHTPQDYGDKNKISMADLADVEAMIGTCLHLPFSEPFYSSTKNDEVAQLQAELQKIVGALYALWEEEYPSNVYISQAMAKRFAIISVFEHIARWDSSMLQKTFVEQAIHEATVFEREVRLAFCKELTF